jgi:branched-chain amino acid transport system ATP-binding protein
VLKKGLRGRASAKPRGRGQDETGTSEERSSSECLVVDGLSAWYGQVAAVRNVSIKVSRGEVVGILGRNGAGKSTLLRSIARVHGGASGNVALEGSDVMRLRPDEVVARGMSLVREGALVFETLTVREHLQLGKRVAETRQQSREIEEVAEWFPMIWKLLGAKGGHLSGGERQMLVLAMAFLGNPTCLMLDEPSAGLAESVCESMYEAIGRIAQGDVALLVAEQDSRWLTGLAKRAYLIELGSVVREAAPDQVGGDELSWTS